jgi:putative ABC transport system permease protein
MQFSSVFQEAMRSLLRNKIRSILTMLGIIVGVASFICVVAVGNAGTQRVEEQLQSLGDNLIWVEAGARAANGVRLGSRQTKSLILEDGRAVIEQIGLIKSMSPNVDGRVQVVYGNLNWGTTYRGVSPEFLEIRKWEMASGAAFTQSDVTNAASVCLLGQTVVDGVFGEEDPVGKIIRVQDMPCRVGGVLQAKGASATGQDQDDFILMPYTTAQKRINGVTWLDDIYFSAISREALPQAKEQITSLLRERHHLHPGEDDDFNIRSPEDVIRMQLQASRTMTFLLGSAASLSLLVGGIGIMNIMLVSVTERTREIGVRMAIGATDQDVRRQFLSEAMVMSICGGALGVLGGFLGAMLLERTLHWQLQMTSTAIVIGGLFSAAVGIFFGYYPANKAAQLDPIEGLRYE